MSTYPVQKITTISLDNPKYMVTHRRGKIQLPTGTTLKNRFVALELARTAHEGGVAYHVAENMVDTLCTRHIFVCYYGGP